MTQSVLITGANRGIGLALAKKYAANGDTVFALCRTASQALKQLNVEIIENIDVTSFSLPPSISHVDILINNAGIYLRDNENFDMMRKEFETNALAPLRVAFATTPVMKKGGKIAMITSRMGSIGDNTSGGCYGYRMSKAALNAASKSLAHDLHEQGIAVGIIHPGWVQTDMVKGTGDISADDVAERISSRINELSLKTSGSFIHSNASKLPW
jgi:NAD(P)-dependent dehydrogenase (short-subunit alcohol dehydrogenase family)